MSKEINKLDLANLTDDEKKQRRIKQQNALHKASGYASQKRYHKEKVHRIAFDIPIRNKDILLKLATDNDTTVRLLFINAFNQTYGVDLSKK